MKLRQHELEVVTNGPGFTDVTAEIGRIVTASAVRRGLCSVFIRHTSASLLIQENADRAVLRDLARWAEHLAPTAPSFGPWEHDDEGPDDMPAHAKATLARTSEQIPIIDGRLGLGTWQGLFVWEHRAVTHRRKLVVTVLGEVDR
jgi:secondary thiamine-phosphate synthase enzyme